MSMLGRAVKNTLALSATELFSKAINFVFIAVLVRHLTPGDFGGYTTVMTLVAFMVPLADMGISQVLVREIAVNRSRSRSLLFNALTVTLGMSGLAWVAMVMVALRANYPDALRPLIVLAGLSMMGNTLMLTTGSVFRGYERMEVLGGLTSALLLVSSLVGIGVALAGQGVAVQIGISIVSALIGVVIMLAVIHRQFVALQWALDARLCWSLARQALPVMVLVFFTVMLRWMDVLILGQLRSMSDVATYSASIKIIDVAEVISLSAGAALFPVLSISWRESSEATQKLYSQSLRFFVAFGLAVAVAISVMADSLVVTTFGAAYASVATPLRLLGWAFFFTTINGPVGALVIAAGDRYRKYVPLIGLIVLGNVALNLFFAPHWGAVGSAGAYVVTGVATFVLRQAIAADYFAHPPRLGPLLWRPAVAALAMGITLWLSRPLSVFVSIPLGGVIFIGMLGLLGELKQEPYCALLTLATPVALRKYLGWSTKTS